MKKRVNNVYFFVILTLLFIVFLGYIFFWYPDINIVGNAFFSSEPDLVFDKNIPLADLNWTFSSPGVIWMTDSQGDRSGFNWNLQGVQDPKVTTTLYAGEQILMNVSFNHILDRYKTEDLTIEIHNGSSLIFSIRTLCDRSSWFGRYYTTVSGRVNGEWQALYRKSSSLTYCERDLFGYKLNSPLGITFSSPNEKMIINVLKKQFYVDSPGVNKTSVVMTLRKDAVYPRTLSVKYGFLSVVNDVAHVRYKKEIIHLKDFSSLNSFTPYILNKGGKIDKPSQIIVEGLLYNKYREIKRFRGEISSNEIGVGKRVPVILYPADESSKQILSQYAPGTLYTLTFSMNEKDSIGESNTKNNQKTVKLCVGDCYREENNIINCTETDKGGGDIGTQGAITLIYSDGRRVEVAKDTCLSRATVIEYSCEAFGNANYSQGVWVNRLRCPEDDNKSWRCRQGVCVYEP